MTLVDGAEPIRAGEELDLARLDAFLTERMPELRGTLEVEQFPSGYSNLTYLLRKGDRELVLRRPPAGVQVKSGHDMAREFKVLSGLSKVFPPAPAPILYSDDPSILGAPFYVMERRRGMVVRKALPEELRGDPALFRRMCESLVDCLADLHAVDYTAAGLADLGKPEGYVRRQVEGWIARWEKAKLEDVPEMDEIARWLRANMPAQSGVTLVHNDYKFDNVILDVDDPTRIVAVLDWEMCTLGDPLMDLGTAMSYWVQADDDPIWVAMGFSPTAAPGGLTRREVAARYGERTGRDVSNMLYYYAFALLKGAVILQQIFYRYAKGFTRDPRFARLGELVGVLARMAVHSAETGKY
jgi:aminoglycoside phosphotransferase (APT) family kinase protein